MKGRKKAYTPPELKKWGTVADLTQTGRTRPGADAKGGSALSMGR
ncbi:MAG: lasso RiPP family leader peptide-containing protein [Actinomycetota bacterium]